MKTQVRIYLQKTEYKPTPLVFGAILLGYHEFLFYPLLQVVLFLGQHFLGLPEFVDGLLR